MSDPKSGDKQFVVVENGQRASGLIPTQEQASQEATTRRKVVEENKGADAPAPKIEVKQNLFG
jgi:hypothetical protein